MLKLWLSMGGALASAAREGYLKGMQLPLRPLAIAMALVVGSASAQLLKFDSIHQEASAKAEDTHLDIKFSFTNPSDKPVRVKALDSTCGCIKAQSDRRVYAPGETGEIEAEFALGAFVGTHQKVVYLDTEAPDDHRYRLTVTVNIPEVVAIEPKVTKWAIGEEAKAKQVDIKFIGDEPMNILEIVATRPQFDVNHETVEAGRHYRVTLKPHSTADAIMGALKIVTDSKTPKYQRQLAFFSVTRVRQSRSAPAPISGFIPAAVPAQ